MMQTFLNMLLHCTHKNRTWPQRKQGIVYEACLDCGRELPYTNRELIAN